MPVQVLDAKSGPVSPPPGDERVTKAPTQTNNKAPQPVEAPPASSKRSDSLAGTEKEPQDSTAASGAGVASNKVPGEGGVAPVELVSDPPGAKIVVDNSPNSECASPCTLSLTNGRHTMTAELNGYTLARRIFTVPDDSSLFVSLSKSMGTLIVTTIPTGSTIFVDGKSYGHTPTTLQLTVGLHRLLLVKGNKQHEETIDVAEGLQAQSYRW